MANIKIHAGDFRKGNSSMMLGVFNLQEQDTLKMLSIHQSELDLVEQASEENVKKLAGTAGWGIAGGALLGPVGLLAGLLLGGNKKEVTFIAQFKDGRKMLGTTDSKTYTKLVAAAFK